MVHGLQKKYSYIYTYNILIILAYGLISKFKYTFLSEDYSLYLNFISTPLLLIFEGFSYVKKCIKCMLEHYYSFNYITAAGVFGWVR